MVKKNGKIGLHGGQNVKNLVQSSAQCFILFGFSFGQEFKFRYIPKYWDTSRAVTVAVTTASPAVVGCHCGCVLPPAVVHVTSHTL